MLTKIEKVTKINIVYAFCFFIWCQSFLKWLLFNENVKQLHSKQMENLQYLVSKFIFNIAVFENKLSLLLMGGGGDPDPFLSIYFLAILFFYFITLISQT